MRTFRKEEKAKVRGSDFPRFMACFWGDRYKKNLSFYDLLQERPFYFFSFL
jgi:hypothetical protein